MERLTKRDKRGAAILAKVKENDYKLEASPVMANVILESQERLAQYEETDLFPEEIKELKKKELLLYLTTRNKIAETGIRLNKTENEIDAMTADTIKEMLNMIDIEGARKIVDRIKTVEGH